MDKRRFLYIVAATLLLIPFQNCSKPLAAKSASDSPLGVLPIEQTLTKIFPIVNITTTNAAPIDSKDVYVAGRLTIDPNGSPGAEAFDAPMKIKGRGNSTWGMPKKPYKIKLDAKASVLGMPADKEWVLLANYSDKTLLRTTVAFELGRQLGMPYVPRVKYVEVNLNGEYLGNYLLTEQLKISPDRVNAAALSATDLTGDAVTGGYLIELDQRFDEDVVFKTSRQVPYAVKDPALVAEQITWITNYMQSLEDNLNSATFMDPSAGYAKDLDVDSFINWYLVSEIFKNQDSAGFSSIYFVKDRNQKLAMGPLWDFDLAAGNVDYSDANKPEGWWVRSGSPWFTRLFEDPAFQAKVKSRWNALKAAEFDKLIPLIDKYAESLGPSQERNFTRWPILNTYVWPNPVVTGSYQGEVDYVKEFLSKRIEWMDKQFNP